MQLNDIQAGEYFTADEAAEMVGKSRDTVILAVAKQVVQPVVVGKMLLFSPDQVRKLLEHFSRRKPYVRHVAEPTIPNAAVEIGQEGDECR